MRQTKESRLKARMQLVMKEWQQRRHIIQVWEAELRKIPGCKLVQILEDFKMSILKSCGKAGSNNKHQKDHWIENQKSVI